MARLRRRAGVEGAVEADEELLVTARDDEPVTAAEALVVVVGVVVADVVDRERAERQLAALVTGVMRGLADAVDRALAAPVLGLALVAGRQRRVEALALGGAGLGVCAPGDVVLVLVVALAQRPGRVTLRGRDVDRAVVLPGGRLRVAVELEGRLLAAARDGDLVATAVALAAVVPVVVTGVVDRPGGRVGATTLVALVVRGLALAVEAPGGGLPAEVARDAQVDRRVEPVAGGDTDVVVIVVGRRGCGRERQRDDEDGPPTRATRESKSMRIRIP